jgi:pimeloyl-ACP methyl ester carboxylesterase
MREGLTVAIAVMASVTACAPTPGKARPEDRFVTVNGVRLHYLDWGGSGEPLLFLTPLGGDLHEQFGTLAPQFTDRLHVLGLTRRGQGQSDKPAAGYDVDTLAADVVGFLDAMGIATAHIAGHSIAGSEMTRLAGLHPSRVSTLVYLDAAVDYQNLAEISSEAGLAAPPDTALAAILVDAGSRQPDYASVQAPALNIVVVFDGPIPGRPGDDAAYTRYLTLAGERDVVGHNIRLFEEAMTRGRTLRLRNTTHGGFLGDPAQQRVFVPVMREFLLTNVTPQVR